MNQNGIQIPLFASATQQNQNDTDFIDFNDLLYDLSKDTSDETPQTPTATAANPMIALYRNEAMAAASLAKQYASAAASLAQSSSQGRPNQNNQSYNNGPGIPTTLMNVQQQNNNNLPSFLTAQNLQSMFPDVQQQNPPINQVRYQETNTPNKRQKMNAMQAPPAVLINQHIQQQKNQQRQQMKNQPYVVGNNHKSISDRIGYNQTQSLTVPPNQQFKQKQKNINNLISSPNIDMLLNTSRNITSMIDMDMTEDNDITKRRERNRVHAKQSRVRKKFFLESLQEQVRKLQEENSKLRHIVQSKMPKHAERILKECFNPSEVFSHAFSCTESSLAKDEGISVGRGELHPFDRKFISSLTFGQRSLIVTNPNEPDNPICFASQGFYDLTGYTPKETIGRNCRFLQGEGTSKEATNIIKVAIESGNDVNVCLLNYKKDGTPFWNQLFIGVLRDWNNNIVNCIGVLCEVKPEDGNSVIEDMVNFVMPLPETQIEKEKENK